MASKDQPEYEPRHNKVPGYFNSNYFGGRWFTYYKNWWDQIDTSSFRDYGLKFDFHRGNFLGLDGNNFLGLAVGGKGDRTWQSAKPVKPLHRDPRIWNELDDDEKARLDALDERFVGMPLHAMKAVAFHYAARCEKEQKLFVLAKSEFRDPRSTLKTGLALSRCAEDTFNFTLKNCYATFTDYARCFETNTGRHGFHCRPEQFAFDKCMHAHGQDKVRLAVQETVVDDADVPWGARPNNPHNFRVVVPDKNKNYDALRSMSSAPDNDAFREFLAKKAQLQEQLDN